MQNSKFIFTIAILIAMVCLPACTHLQPASCNDKSLLQDYLSLDRKTFDQDEQKGWRVMAHKGCDEVAGNMIKSYILYSPHVTTDNLNILRWHAGQNYAVDGQYNEALLFFIASYQEPGDYYSESWNLYVEGTVAFIHSDREVLTSSIQNLETMVFSDDGIKARTEIFGRGLSSKQLENILRKDSNLIILKGLLSCLGKTYKEAYGRETCQT